MSLARAFTKRTKRTADVPAAVPGRAATVSHRKGSSQGINRSLISSPVELLSTTNMLSYNAPDLPNPTLRHISSSSSSSLASKKSSEDFDAAISSPDLTDASSVDSGSPTSPLSPKENHLSSYFAAANGMKSIIAPGTRPRRAASATSLNAQVESNEPSPALPERAVSHSKQAHEQIARQRSMHNMGSSRGSTSSSEPRSSREHRSSREQRSSADIFRINDDPSHPFGKELEQLKEIVEEFGSVVTEAEINEDMVFMRDHGLAKFSVVDYLSEIQPLFCRAFDSGFDRRLPAVQEVGWI